MSSFRITSIGWNEQFMHWLIRCGLSRGCFFFGSVNLLQICFRTNCNALRENDDTNLQFPVKVFVKYISSIAIYLCWLENNLIVWWYNYTTIHMPSKERYKWNSSASDEIIDAVLPMTNPFAITAGPHYPINSMLDNETKQSYHNRPRLTLAESIQFYIVV